MTSSVQQVVLSGSYQCYLRTLFWQPESRHTSYWYFRLCETNPPVCVLHSPHIYTVHAHDEVCYLDQVSATQIEMSNHSSMSPGFKFVHATPHSSFFQARCVKLMRDLTPSQRFFNNFLSSLSFSLSLSFGAAAAAASALLRPSYHAEQTLYSSAPACSDWNFPAGTPGLLFFPPHQVQLPNTMPFMPRGENRRTMWRTCSVFCAWSLLFLAEVCAQSQRRYTFIYSFIY